MKPLIRKAKMSDREALHAAHMRSIREVCVKDHGKEEISGWGFRELGDRWIDGINKNLVWVIEASGQIQGVAAMTIAEKEAHIQALYLTPEVIGLGLAKQLAEIMLETAKERNAFLITLESTITAYGFYKKLGFEDAGPVTKRPVGGVPVTSYPMRMDLTSASS